MKAIMVLLALQVSIDRIMIQKQGDFGGEMNLNSIIEVQVQRCFLANTSLFLNAKNRKIA